MRKENNTENRQDMYVSPGVTEQEEQEVPLIAETMMEEEHRHHSHHHHHHRRHHSKRRWFQKSYRSSAPKRDNRFVRFVKRNKHTLINIVACLVSLLLVVQIAIGHDTATNNSAKPNDFMVSTESTIQIETSVYADEISLVHPAVDEYLKTEGDLVTVTDLWGKYHGNANRLDCGIPLRYKYNVKGLPKDLTVESVSLFVADNQALKNPVTYELDGNIDHVDMYHLIPATTYHYRLDVTLSNGSVVGNTGSFQTAATPRIMKIDGAINVRDIGGWNTTDDQRVRFGLLYRGGELDGAVEPTYCLTDDGLNDMLSVLGIRYDFDLRSPEDNIDGKHPLGANVKHTYYDAPMYSSIFEASHTETVRTIFSELSKKENYPMYLHCTYGRDRTGTVCYLLAGLLGVSQEDAQLDYELSAFVDGHQPVEAFTAFITRLELLEGNTFKEKVEGYLLSIGVTEEEIANIRSIFLEK